MLEGLVHSMTCVLLYLSLMKKMIEYFCPEKL